MTLWGSMWSPSSRIGMTDRCSKKIVKSDDTRVIQSTDNPRTAATRCTPPCHETVSHVSYSMIQSSATVVDEKVGWANYLDYM